MVFQKKYNSRGRHGKNIKKSNKFTPWDMAWDMDYDDGVKNGYHERLFMRNRELNFGPQFVFSFRYERREGET